MNLLNQSLSWNNMAPNYIVNGLQTQSVQTHSSSLKTGQRKGARTSRSVKRPWLLCRMAYMQWATVTACFQLW